MGIRNGKRRKSILAKLEQLEEMLEVNSIRVYYASDEIKETGDDVINVRLKWLDVPEKPFVKIEDVGILES